MRIQKKRGRLPTEQKYVKENEALKNGVSHKAILTKKEKIWFELEFNKTRSKRFTTWERSRKERPIAEL